jgi:hypothetical protein
VVLVSQQPITAAAMISFCTALEADSARFYAALAERYPAQRQAFEGYAQACAKSGAQIRRTYQETISDALETGFSFPGLALDAYQIDVSLPEGIDLAQAVERALALEGAAAAFYQDAAERSASLLATIPRAFRRAARVRRRRREALASL